jgi:hypothetical protein
LSVSRGTRAVYSQCNSPRTYKTSCKRIGPFYCKNIPCKKVSTQSLSRQYPVDMLVGGANVPVMDSADVRRHVSTPSLTHPLTHSLIQLSHLAIFPLTRRQRNAVQKQPSHASTTVHGSHSSCAHSNELSLQSAARTHLQAPAMPPAAPSQRAKKTRAKHACRECNSRRVRCNVTEVQPCTNCAVAGAKCEILPSRRGR